MRAFCLLLMTIFISGCAIHKKGFSRTDSYDAVKVDQMSGNNVSWKAFQRTILCLNARRKTRVISSLTNTAVVVTTNVSLRDVTNLTVTVIANQSRTFATNIIPQAPLSVMATNEP